MGVELRPMFIKGGRPVTYRLHREFREGKLHRLWLDIPEVDAYLEFIRHRCRPNTWVSHAYDLQIFVNAVSKSVLEVNPTDIFTFIRQQRETPNTSHVRNRSEVSGLSNRTIKRRLSTISTLYSYLLVRGDTPLRSNPVPRGLPVRGQSWNGQYNKVTPLLRTPRTLPQVLESEELNRFLRSLRTQRDRAMIFLMLFGGLRKAEVIALTLEDVHFGRRTVLVRQGKGGHQRLIPIASMALRAVASYLAEERPPSSVPQLFVVLKGPHKGCPLSIAGLDTIVSYNRQKAGTPRVQCHRLRHTCLTRLREAGMSLEALQAQAGHRDINSTRNYLHLCQRHFQEEYLRVSNALFLPEASGGTVQ